MTPATTVPTGHEPLLSKRSIAAHYSVSVRTVERWMFDGCPSRLVGAVRRFRLSEVDAFLHTYLTEEH
jgi:hypothetical protein